MNTLSLTIIDKEFTIHRLDLRSGIPDYLTEEEFFWIGKTDEELSIICASEIPINSVLQNEGWKAIKVIGPLALSSIGVLSSLSSLLAENKISIFALSTYDTDFVLVKTADLGKAKACLIKAGYIFI